ncbi:MAG: isoprenylcysteine carboxylmethyltransferase family protein [Azoarcus sp.]|jgi:protein-S-isoprenylcysteine O-methyltransferase Ste14|nr:isoprenylcysteine carboxylmethyltransferase family protein [Azoarcus sp.]
MPSPGFSFPRALPPLHLKVPPALLAALIAGIMWLVDYFIYRGQPSTLQFYAGSPIALAGGIISAVGLISFFCAKTTINPIHPERTAELVTSGIFRLSRNPIYLGLVLSLIGLSVRLASPPTLFGPLVFACYTHYFQILPEERILAAVFGDEYERYKANVRRWL